MNSESSQNAYDTWHASQADEEHQAESLYPWHRTVARLLPELNELKVLEIGCGRGDFAISLGKKSPDARISAIDFSRGAVEIARTRARQREAANVVFDVGDAEQLGFDDEQFDCVISCEVLEHMHHPDAMAREIRRVLKPTGRYFLTTENYLNGMLLSWFVCWLRNEPFNSGAGVQPHENFFLFWRVKRLLKRAGLRVDHMESNHFQWLLLPRVAPVKLCTEDFRCTFFKRLFRPFGRHFTFVGRKG